MHPFPFPFLIMYLQLVPLLWYKHSKTSGIWTANIHDGKFIFWENILTNTLFCYRDKASKMRDKTF